MLMARPAYGGSAGAAGIAATYPRTMPRLHAYELLPDDAGRDAVLADWQALRDAGCRSQLDHKGTTDSPHVTVAPPRRSGRTQDALAVRRLGPALPVEVRTSGIALLGGSRVSVVRLLDVPDDLVRAVLALRSDVPRPSAPGLAAARHRSARRIARADVVAALAALRSETRSPALHELRRWDPDAGTVRTIATSASTIGEDSA